MNINFTGHHVEVTDAIREFTTDKLAQLDRHHDKITSIKVIYNIEKLMQIAEATVYIPKHEVFARAESDNLYDAIDSLVNKLIVQLEKHKNKDKQRNAH